MIEQDVRVEASATERGFKVQMLGCGATRAARQSYHLSSLHLIAHLYKVFRLVAIQRFQPPRVFNNNAVAIAIIRARARYHAIKGRYNLVVGLGLQVNASMATLATIGANNLCARQRIGPTRVFKFLKIKLIGIACGKWVDI